MVFTPLCLCQFATRVSSRRAALRLRPLYSGSPALYSPPAQTFIDTVDTPHSGLAKQRSSFQLYSQLGKHRLTALVTFTATAAFVTAFPVGNMPLLSCAAITGGTYLQGLCANAINQMREIEFDRLMKRTRLRPLVTGELTTSAAGLFAASCGVVGTVLLWQCCSPLTAALGVLNIVVYTGLYTSAKRRHWINTWIGAIVGAIPPLMGAAAAFACGASLTASLSVAAGVSFAVYAWQLPHFLSLATFRRGDYAAAGYKMLPIEGADGPQRAARASRRNAAALVLVPPILLAPVSSVAFTVEAAVLAAGFLYFAQRFVRSANTAEARLLFRASLLYLPLLLILMIVHRIREDVPCDVFGCVHRSKNLFVSVTFCNCCSTSQVPYC